MFDDTDRSAEAPASPPAPDETEILDAYSRAVIHVVDTVGPSVVQIGAARRGRSDSGGTGTGVVVTPDGYALTNSHVVRGKKKLGVTLADGRATSARLVGDDPATDLAVLRLEGSDLPFATLGASTSLRRGQLVIAIGHPLGLESTVSTGIVSALGRSLRGRDGRLIEGVVQHTAPLNPGNSGGPLVDSRGRVVGINAAMLWRANGIGFAIPASTASWVVSQILQHGRVRRATLGIAAQNRSSARTEAAIEIMSVVSGSPAERAGLKAGDLIVAFGEQTMTNVDDLHRALGHWSPGREVALQVLRNGDRTSLVVSPEEDRGHAPTK